MHTHNLTIVASLYFRVFSISIHLLSNLYPVSVPVKRRISSIIIIFREEFQTLKQTKQSVCRWIPLLCILSFRVNKC